MDSDAKHVTNYLIDEVGGDPRNELAARFASAQTHAEIVDLVWAFRALIDDDAVEAPFFMPGAIARTVVYAECLGLYFIHANRILGRSPYPVEVDEIETGFCNPWLEAKKPERMARGRAVLATILAESQQS